MAKEILKENKKEANPSRPNFWGAMRDILVASLQKGQFIPGLIGFCVMVGLIKMQSTDVYRFFSGVIALFRNSYYWGWILLLFVTLVSSRRIKRIQKLHQQELLRIKKQNEEIKEDNSQLKIENGQLKLQIGNKSSTKK